MKKTSKIIFASLMSAFGIASIAVGICIPLMQSKNTPTPTPFASQINNRMVVVIPALSVVDFRSGTPNVHFGDYKYSTQEKKILNYVNVATSPADSTWHICLESYKEHGNELINFSSKDLALDAFQEYFASDPTWFYSKHLRECITCDLAHISSVTQHFAFLEDNKLDTYKLASIWETLKFSNGLTQHWAYYPSSESDMLEVINFNELYLPKITNDVIVVPSPFGKLPTSNNN